MFLAGSVGRAAQPRPMSRSPSAALGIDLVATRHARDGARLRTGRVQDGSREADQCLDPAPQGELTTVRCATAGDWRLARVLIREVMTKSVVSAAPARTVREIAELMRERNVSSVVLVDDPRPVGFVTDRDLALSVIADGRDFGDHVAGRCLLSGDHRRAEMKVRGKGGQLMVRHGIRRLVVVDGGRLTGIVTLDDLASRTGDAELASQLSTRVDPRRDGRTSSSTTRRG